MTDIFNKEKRSEVMSKVSRRNTLQEVLVRKYLFSNGFRFRNNYTKLPGSPDIVLPKYNIAIFVHGCFWHGHRCKAARLPKSNIEFWNIKIETNKKRDRRKSGEVRKLGWRVITIWQCKLNGKKKQDITLKKLVCKIISDQLAK